MQLRLSYLLNNTTTIEDIQLIPLNFVGIDNKNVNQKIINSIDILGRKNNTGKNKLLFNIFEDGKIERKITIE